jgi:hypothetical protein
VVTERRGGKRQGTKGKQYSNRSDLRQAPQAATGQTYGVAKQQMDAQRAIPLAKTPVPGVAPSPASPSGGVSALAGMLGGGGSQVAVPSLTAPTTRPNEPLTAGLPTGPGAGPEALNLPSPDDDLLASLRAMYRAYPNDDIARLMAALEARINSAPRRPNLQSAPRQPNSAASDASFMGRLGRISQTGGGQSPGTFAGTDDSAVRTPQGTIEG